MKLEAAQQAYRDLSGKASDVGRTLALAGIAVVWIFKTGTSTLPPEMLRPLAAFVGALILDLAQYAYGAIAWGAFSRYNEKRGVAEFKAPRWINWPSVTFFWGKLLALAAGYVALYEHLLPRI